MYTLGISISKTLIRRMESPSHPSSCCRTAKLESSLHVKKKLSSVPIYSAAQLLRCIISHSVRGEEKKKANKLS